MERLSNKVMFSNVERNKTASRVCHELFPGKGGLPVHGDLQRIIVALSEHPDFKPKAKAVGDWWLWAKDLVIDNTFPKAHRKKVLDLAIESVQIGRPIHFVSARSPELLHAQVPNQGDPTLPRSRKAIATLAEIITKSEEFLPTKLTIALADLAIDNLEKIKQVCNPEETVLENIRQIEEMCKEARIANFEVARLSALEHPSGRLKDMVDPSGAIKVPVTLSSKAIELIRVATNESSQSHKRMFGWTEEQSSEHNRNLGITMGLVGQSIKQLTPPAILIHNESFISRGALNNLFTDEKNPLPVFCLRTLLETKKAKF